MIDAAPPLLFRFRETVATMPSVLALIMLVLLGVQQTVRLTRHADEPPVQISLTEPEPVPEARPETPRPPQPEPPKPKVVQPQPKQPPQPVSRPLPSVAASAPELPPAAPRAAEAPPPAAPAPVPPPAAPKPVAASIEAEYVGKLRAHLNSIKRYPTGREASQLRPQGKVRIWFVLRRDGSVADVGIDASSNSMLLDDAARKTIHRATFSAFPENTWAGESSHRFTAELDFIPAG